MHIVYGEIDPGRTSIFPGSLFSFVMGQSTTNSDPRVELKGSNSMKIFVIWPGQACNNLRISRIARMALRIFHNSLPDSCSGNETQCLSPATGILPRRRISVNLICSSDSRLLHVALQHRNDHLCALRYHLCPRSYLRRLTFPQLLVSFHVFVTIHFSYATIVHTVYHIPSMVCRHLQVTHAWVQAVQA